MGIFLFTIASRTALGSTQPPIQWVPGALSLGVKWPGHEANHSPPSSSEAKNEWRSTSTPQYAVLAWCSAKAQGELYLYLYRHAGCLTNSFTVNYKVLRRSVYFPHRISTFFSKCVMAPPGHDARTSAWASCPSLRTLCITGFQ
jgi:hypothetical protein